MFEVPKAISEYWPDDAWARESWQARDQSFGDMSVYLLGWKLKLPLWSLVLVFL